MNERNEMLKWIERKYINRIEMDCHNNYHFLEIDIWPNQNRSSFVSFLCFLCRRIFISHILGTETTRHTLYCHRLSVCAIAQTRTVFWFLEFELGLPRIFLQFSCSCSMITVVYRSPLVSLSDFFNLHSPKNFNAIAHNVTESIAKWFISFSFYDLSISFVTYCLFAHTYRHSLAIQTQ